MVGRSASSNPSQVTLNIYLTYKNRLPTTHLGGKAKGGAQGVRTLAPSDTHIHVLTIKSSHHTWHIWSASNISRVRPLFSFYYLLFTIYNLLPSFDYLLSNFTDWYLLCNIYFLIFTIYYLLLISHYLYFFPLPYLNGRSGTSVPDN